MPPNFYGQLVAAIIPTATHEFSYIKTPIVT